MPKHIEVRDNLFYYSDEESQKTNLVEIAKKILKDNKIGIHEIVPGDDSISLLVDDSIENLMDIYPWEQTCSDFIYIYIDERVEISFTPDD